MIIWWTYKLKCIGSKLLKINLLQILYICTHTYCMHLLTYMSANMVNLRGYKLKYLNPFLYWLTILTIVYCRVILQGGHVPHLFPSKNAYVYMVHFHFADNESTSSYCTFTTYCTIICIKPIIYSIIQCILIQFILLIINFIFYLQLCLRFFFSEIDFFDRKTSSNRHTCICIHSFSGRIW